MRRGRSIARRGVDRDDARHLRALDAHGDDDAHLCAGQHGVVPGRVQDRRMQEGVALPVEELDEAEPFVVLVPFHCRVDSRLTRRRGRKVARRRRIVAEFVGSPVRAHWALPRRVRHRAVVVEPVLARRPEFLSFVHSDLTLRPVQTTGRRSRSRPFSVPPQGGGTSERRGSAGNGRVPPRPDADRGDVRRLVEGRGIGRRRRGLPIGRRGGNGRRAVVPSDAERKRGAGDETGDQQAASCAEDCFRPGAVHERLSSRPPSAIVNAVGGRSGQRRAIKHRKRRNA